MKNLHFRAPGRATPLRELAQRAWVGAHPRQIAKACEAGRIRVGGRVVHDPDRRIEAGAVIAMTVQEGLRPPPVAALEILHRGPDHCVVVKPSGWPSHAATPGGADARAIVADALGRELADIRPAHRLDADVSGAWLIALGDEAATRLSRAFAEGRVEKEYRALAPALPWPEGELRGAIDGRDASTRFQVLCRRDGVCELSLVPVSGRTHQLRRHLADARAPILADPLYGGAMIAGGLRLYSRRLRLHDEGIDVVAPEPTGFAFDEPFFRVTRKPASLRVSKSTISALENGHPWILTDTETSDVGGLPPGMLARARGPAGEDGGLFRIEGPGVIAARLWARTPRDGADDAIGERVGRALARRRTLIAPLQDPGAVATNCIRLIHGEADGLPGLHVDLLGDELRVLQLGRACEPLIDELVDHLCRELSSRLAREPAVVLVRHLAERPPGEFLCVEPLRGVPRTGPFEVTEHGHRFEVENGLAERSRSRPGFGLFIDQRENRRRIAERIRDEGGGRWLNLFCHTGAFSIAALAAGAEEVVSVDLSRPYLEALERNLARNGIPADRHSILKMDVERFLERLPERERFDGIILDPPTAASAGRRFWTVRKKQRRLMAICLDRLHGGGTLLACRNDRGARASLAKELAAAARDGAVSLREVLEAPPGEDFPRLAGFPEGDAFQALLVTRR